MPMNDGPAITALGYTREVVLADESRWDGSGGMSSSQQDLWIWLDGNPNLSDVIWAFNNPEKTAVIRTETHSVIDPSGATHQFEGFTKLTDLSITPNQISIRLTKP